MRQGEQMAAIMQQAGRSLMALVDQRINRLPRGDQSGWYYIAALGPDTSEGRQQAYIKPLAGTTGPGNKQLGPFPCLRTYTPVVGHRVLVRWVAGDRADGVIEG
jgi:hypothetical protein